MPRQYATFDCGMWDEPNEFAELSAGAQRTYFMLVTQRDISPCGLLPLTLRRWASTCADKGVDEWLKELETCNYVLIDEHTEELLVRTFMKWDAGYKHAKRVQAVVAAALAIRSQPIRRAAIVELEKLSVRVPNKEAIGSVRSVVEEVSTDLTPGTALPDPESMNQSREPSPPSGAHSPFCDEHQPNGTDDDCRKCARRRLNSHARLEAEVAARKAAAEARDACTLCDEKGWIVNERSGQPVRRCTHTVDEAVSA